MTLSPSAVPFFSCSSSLSYDLRNSFLEKAESLLSSFDLKLFRSILTEWESHPLLSSCLSLWEKCTVPNHNLVPVPLHVLSFNVRGFESRWQEVLLLTTSFNFDVLVLLETGDVDLSFCAQAFSNFRVFFQHGENKCGGVLVMVRSGIQVSRVECKLANVCAIDVKVVDEIRIVGVYAPASRSWSWDQLSHLVSNKCSFFGDYNVDLMRDGEKAELLLGWADSHFLAPFVPDCSTSLRSDRTIDYVLSNVPNVEVQTYKGNTTSDHLPLLAVVCIKGEQPVIAKSVHWKVFTLFTEFTFSFWDRRWRNDCMNDTYSIYIRFLKLLENRCAISFPVKKYRMAIPVELRCFMSAVRALSFRQMRTRSVELKTQVRYLRKMVKKELRCFVASQLSAVLHLRHTSSSVSVSFWSKTKRFIKPPAASLRAFLSPAGDAVKDSGRMAEMAADFYENLFRKSDNIVRPHPYVDAPWTEFDNRREPIPDVTLEELRETVQARKKKKSRDANGLCNFMFSFIHQSHWSLLLLLFNRSFSMACMPTAWKDTRILLLAKKESICLPAQTRPISLLDSFQKVGEKLFLTRFRDVLGRRGLLPNNQSGFRAGFRLQTRLLLFLEDLYSLMSNSSPVATIFVDFKNAFDMLWHEGCVGKFRQMGIPWAYCDWIRLWLENRRGYIEIGGEKSRWFRIEKGGPQGGILTPTVFITYNADMPNFLSWCSSHFFADDLAAVVAGEIGVKFSNQCLDVEKRLKQFFVQLELYSLLTIQPINFSKTEGLWSARAIGSAPFDIACGEEKISWVKSFKYLGYWVCPKLGWGRMIQSTMEKVRKRISLINSFRLEGKSSFALRRALFSSYVLPLFTWLFPLFPLFTAKQVNDLSHFYYTCLKRTMFCLEWSDGIFSFVFDEISLQDRCGRYWNKYLIALADSTDGELLFENASLNMFRKAWVDREVAIKGLRISKRFVENSSILEKCVKWTSAQPSGDSIPHFEMEEIELLQFFPESFLFD